MITQLRYVSNEDEKVDRIVMPSMITELVTIFTSLSDYYEYILSINPMQYVTRIGIIYPCMLTDATLENKTELSKQCKMRPGRSQYQVRED